MIMTELKKWFAAVMLVAAFIGSAKAADMTSDTNVGFLTSFAAGVNYMVPPATPGATFSDTFRFSLAGPSTFVSALTTLTFLPLVGISNFLLELQAPGGGSISTFAPTTIGVVSVIQTPQLTLAGGIDYKAIVTGTVSGATGGSYTVNMAAAPVPEPAEWMMLLAGLLVMGFIARRRNNPA
jgi:hypothetical protein